MYDGRFCLQFDHREWRAAASHFWADLLQGKVYRHLQFRPLCRSIASMLMAASTENRIGGENVLVLDTGKMEFSVADHDLTPGAVTCS
jgi:hypothetical protein